MQDNAEVGIASYEQGTAVAAEVQDAVASAWAEILADPAARAEAAEALGVAGDQLPERAPLRVRSSAAGLSGAGLDLVYNALVGFGGAVAYDMMKDEAKKALRAAGRRLWDVLRPRAEERMDMAALGPEVRVDDDVQ